MTNVFTRKNRHPRTTTMLDYRVFNSSITRPMERILSPARLANPHPVGLEHQNIPGAANYLIWHPDFTKKEQHLPKMFNHIRFQNFSCQHPIGLECPKKRGQPPVIHYRESTTMRASYINPSRFPELARLSGAGSRVSAPKSKGVTGIVPNLLVSAYLPVIEK